MPCLYQVSFQRKRSVFTVETPRWCVGPFDRVYLEVKSLKKRRSCSTGAFEKVPTKIGRWDFLCVKASLWTVFGGSSTEAKLERLLRWWPFREVMVWNWRPKYSVHPDQQISYASWRFISQYKLKSSRSFLANASMPCSPWSVRL